MGNEGLGQGVKIDAVCTLEKDHRLLNNKSYMLTKSDLNQIGNVIDNKLEPIKKDLTILKTDVTILNKDVKYLKKKVNRIDRTVSLIVKNYDEADVKLEKRVRKIEHHLVLD